VTGMYDHEAVRDHRHPCDHPPRRGYAGADVPEEVGAYQNIRGHWLCGDESGCLGGRVMRRPTEADMDRWYAESPYDADADRYYFAAPKGVWVEVPGE
jgi:hypothetical protein